MRGTAGVRRGGPGDFGQGGWTRFGLGLFDLGGSQLGCVLGVLSLFFSCPAPPRMPAMQVWLSGSKGFAIYSVVQISSRSDCMRYCAGASRCIPPPMRNPHPLARLSHHTGLIVFPMPCNLLPGPSRPERGESRNLKLRNCGIHTIPGLQDEVQVPNHVRMSTVGFVPHSLPPRSMPDLGNKNVASAATTSTQRRSNVRLLGRSAFASKWVVQTLRHLASR